MSIHTYVGVLFTERDLYKKCLCGSTKFQHIIKNAYIGDNFTYEEFYNYVGGFSQPYSSNTIDNMLDTISDSSVELDNVTYPGSKLPIIRITPDDADDTMFIVGKCVAVTSKSGLPEMEESPEDLVHKTSLAFAVLKEAQLTNYKLYNILKND